MRPCIHKTRPRKTPLCLSGTNNALLTVIMLAGPRYLSKESDTSSPLRLNTTSSKLIYFELSQRSASTSTHRQPRITSADSSLEYRLIRHLPASRPQRSTWATASVNAAVSQSTNVAVINSPLLASITTTASARLVSTQSRVAAAAQDQRRPLMAIMDFARLV